MYKRAIITALVVGSILTLINQVDSLFGPDEFIVWQALLSTLVPFLVSIVSAKMTMRHTGTGSGEAHMRVSTDLEPSQAQDGNEAIDRIRSALSVICRHEEKAAAAFENHTARLTDGITAAQTLQKRLLAETQDARLDSKDAGNVSAGCTDILDSLLKDLLSLRTESQIAVQETATSISHAQAALSAVQDLSRRHRS